MKLLLIDGSNLIFRAYYATEKNMIYDKDKNPVNAIHTLIPMINKLINQFEPTHAFIALDSGKSTFRHKMYPEYKGKRSETPENLKKQFPIALKLYDAMGIKNFATDEYEADDLIATYAVNAKTLGYDVQIVSGDKDLLQLVAKGIKVMTPGIGFAKEINYDEAVFKEKYSFSPNRFIEYKALVGDSSDNIIGVQGLGDKTAKKLINQFETFEDLLNHSTTGIEKAKVWQRLKESHDQIDENLKLVTLIDDITLDTSVEQLKFESFDLENFLPFLAKYGFSKFHTQFAKDSSKKTVSAIVEKNQNILKYAKDVSEIYVVGIYEEQNYIEKQIKTICLRIGEKNFIYRYDEFEALNTFLSTYKGSVVVYNNKALLSVIEPIKGLKFDIYLGAALLNSEFYKKNIDFLGFQYGVSEDASIISKIKNDENIDQCCCQILGFINKLHINILSELEEISGYDILEKIELPLSFVLSEMEKSGVYFNRKKLEELKLLYETQMFSVEQKLQKLCPINYNSPSQLSVFLFETNNIPSKGIKKTSKSFSTDAESLKKVINNIKDDESHNSNVQMINMLLEYRKIKKILSTYLIGFEKHLKGNKIFPLFNQLAVETGRISIVDPNIQNIPIKSKEGRVLRSLFDSGDYEHFVSIDYSQVELRVIAHIANERNMINDFENGLDIHEQTAKKILGVDKINSDERSKAKAINFGIIYGMSPYGLAKQVGISNEEAKFFIEKYFEAYPNIKKYMEESISFAMKNNYVKTEFNRQRKINAIHSTNKMEFESACRIAINSRIQGTAADIIKLAMIEIHNYLKKCSSTKLAMQIHDELVFYTNDLDEIKEIKAIMETVVNYRVRLTADMNCGNDWLEAK